jgi:hypothetical protein
MFADVGDAFFLTLIIWLLLGFVLLASLLPKKRRGTARIFAMLIILFIPACLGITELRYVYRYGEFVFDSAVEISDSRVRRWMPEQAREIDLRSYATGMEAEYVIGYAELHAFIAGFYQRMKDIPDYANNRNFVRDYHEFMALDATLPDAYDDEVVFRSPRAPNGAGFIITFDPTTGRASQQANYW